ncbi:Glutathione S-transferase, N-terminal domain [Popillia japonica]|uniref:Glutathione S-transferase, N-terminal domain n=1 Tax=Popillia japonica TaxID=7064 RepID=A0AAW1IVA6_POPJA
MYIYSFDVSRYNSAIAVLSINTCGVKMPLTLYYITDGPPGPPSVACRMLLKAMNIDCNYVKMDFLKGDHLTEEYAKKNPQKEIPVLDDDGFYLSESTAILQYLADKYGKNDTFYPKDVKARAIVNQRLAFNATRYYRYIEDYILPLFFDYERTDLMSKKVHVVLDTFNTYLERLGTKYAAGDNLTIADLQFIGGTMCLEAIAFDFSSYSHVTKWYNTFKRDNPELWKIADEAKEILIMVSKERPDLSTLYPHPVHPIRLTKA